MKSRFVPLSVLVGGVLACGVTHNPVSAANFNTQTTHCQTTNPDKTSLIVHDAIGVRTAPQVTTPLAVTCSIPRSPLDPSRSAGFYVDGDNFGGALTECFISSYDYTGTFLASASFSTSSAQYDMWLSLSPAASGPWAYMSLTCYLPPNGQGVLRGVTAVQ